MNLELNLAKMRKKRQHCKQNLGVEKNHCSSAKNFLASSYALGTSPPQRAARKFSRPVRFQSPDASGGGDDDSV
jgi:hypothetical protein